MSRNSYNLTQPITMTSAVNTQTVVVEDNRVSGNILLKIFQCILSIFCYLFHIRIENTDVQSTDVQSSIVRDNIKSKALNRVEQQDEVSSASKYEYDEDQEELLQFWDDQQCWDDQIQTANNSSISGCYAATIKSVDSSKEYVVNIPYMSEIQRRTCREIEIILQHCIDAKGRRDIFEELEYLINYEYIKSEEDEEEDDELKDEEEHKEEYNIVKKKIQHDHAAEWLEDIRRDYTFEDIISNDDLSSEELHYRHISSLLVIKDLLERWKEKVGNFEIEQTGKYRCVNFYDLLNASGLRIDETKKQALIDQINFFFPDAKELDCSILPEN